MATFALKSGWVKPMQIVPRWSKSTHSFLQPVAEAPAGSGPSRTEIIQALKEGFYRLWESSVCLATPGVSGDEQSLAECFYDWPEFEATPPLISHSSSPRPAPPECQGRQPTETHAT